MPVVSNILSTRPVTFTFVRGLDRASPGRTELDRTGDLVGQTGLLIRAQITVVY